MGISRDDVQNMQLIPRDVSGSNFDDLETITGFQWNLGAMFDRFLSGFGFQSDMFRQYQGEMTPEYDLDSQYMVIETTESVEDITSTESATSIVIGNEEFNAAQGRAVEIDDLNQVLADESGSTESENNLLLQQMTVIIIFIMFCGTMYVLRRYWLEKRSLSRDLDYYRLS